MSLRVASISFLNPAPLLYNFEHEPAATRLAQQYALHSTSPSACAAELHAGAADLGLIPIAALTPELRIVPGCAIASLDQVRSILLLVKNPGRLPTQEALTRVSSVAADSASRSSVAYARILFERFHATHPVFVEQSADPLAMLAAADAALLIGDPALLAREHRDAIDGVSESTHAAPLLWLDLAQMWRERTGLPWVAAVWAVRPAALVSRGQAGGPDAAQLIADLNGSRDAGLAHIEDLVQEWTPRLALPAETIRTYLTRNIYYYLNNDCLQAIKLFRSLAAEIGALPPLSELAML